MQASIAQSLSQSRLMTGMPVELMESLAECFGETRDVPAGEVFKKAGDEADAAFLVRSGNVQVSENRGLADGAYAYTVGQGEIVGVPALLNGSEESAEFRAAEDTTLASLGPTAIRRLAFIAFGVPFRTRTERRSRSAISPVAQDATFCRT